MADEYILKADVLNLPQSIERNLRGEIVERSIDVKAIESLEPADVVQVVYGKWINTAPRYRSDNIICDHCGYDSIAAYRYCPNCGAKMDGKKEG